MSLESGTYEEIKTRLSEIADLVSDENINLEEALALYEEAAKLGLTACDMSEKDIFPPRENEADRAEDQELEVADVEVVEVASADVPTMPYPQDVNGD